MNPASVTQTVPTQSLSNAAVLALVELAEGAGMWTLGAAGKAILLNSKTATWLGGNDATHVKGAVQ